MESPFAHLWLFLLAVAYHTTTLLAGCVVTVLIGIIEKHLLRRPISGKLEIGVLLLFIFFAAFQAWRDQYDKASKMQQPSPPIQITMPPINIPPAQVVIQQPKRESNKPSKRSPAQPSASREAQPTAAPPISATTPPTPENVRIVSQENVSSDQPQWPFKLKVVLQTDVTIAPVAFAFMCDGRIEKGETGFGAGAPVMLTMSQDFVGSLEGEPIEAQDIYFTEFQSPAFSPERSMIVWLYSKSQVRVTKMQQVQYQLPYPVGH